MSNKSTSQGLITITFKRSEDALPLVKKLLEAGTFMEFAKVLETLLKAEEAMEIAVDSGTAHGGGGDITHALNLSKEAGYENIGALRQVLRESITVRDYLP